MHSLCKKMGTQTWVCIAIIMTELLICLKFDWETVTKPFPPEVAFWWYIFLSALVTWTIGQFLIRPYLWPEEAGEVDKKKNK